MQLYPMQLSKRQKEILRLMVDGKNNKEIAKAMGIKSGTVVSQKWTARIKAGVRDELALYKWAVANPKEIK
jgi:DNA-binding CsgD family transcriptional regulator